MLVPWKLQDLVCDPAQRPVGRAGNSGLGGDNPSPFPDIYGQVANNHVNLKRHFQTV